MKKSSGSIPSTALRQRAEQRLGETQGDNARPSAAELEELAHELQVHQIELQIQNEELRDSQLALEESRDKYAELYDFAPLGYLTLDRTGRIVKANLAAEALLGVDRKDLLGARFSRFIDGDSQDAWHLHQQRVMHGVSKETCEVQVSRESRTLHVESRAREDATESVQILTVLLDISAIKRMEREIQTLNAELTRLVADRTRELMESNEKLRDSENRMRAILETAADAIIMTDESGTIVSFNQMAERMFGYSTDEAIGLSFETLMSLPDGERFGHLEDHLRTRRSIRTEVRGLCKNGERFPAELAVSEFADGGRRFSVIIRDISERRRLEREIAEISSTEQRRFAQDLHDGLCQELAGIGFMACVLEQRLLERSAPEAQQMARIARLVGEAVEQTRALAKGLFPVHLETVGLAATLRVLAQETEAECGMSCLLDCDEVIRIEDDNAAADLYYIAREAITNAVRHGMARTVVVTLTQHSGRITLKIEDDGVGLPDKLDPDKGMGLRIMDYRAGRIGASLKVRRRGARGTVVTCAMGGA